MNPSRSIFAGLLLALLVVAPAFAQKALEDPRPRTGLNNDHIPRYESVEAFMARPGAVPLVDRMTSVGTARLEPFTINRKADARVELVAGKSAAEVQLSTVRRADNGSIRWLTGNLGRISPSAGKNSAAITAEAIQVLENLAGDLLLHNPAQEMRPMSTTMDELSYSHVRFEQVYEGIPVWGRDLFVHVDATGAVYAVNGTYEPTPATASTRPSLLADQAVSRVITQLENEGRWAPLSEETARAFGIDLIESELVLYPHPDRGTRLAYEVSVHPNLVERFTYLVDAQTGDVLNRIQEHCTLHYDPNADAVPRFDAPSFSSAAASPGANGTFHDATAPDLNGVSRTVRTYQHTDGTFYSVWDLPNLDLARSTMPSEPAGGAITITANNQDLKQDTQLLHVTSPNNTWTDPTSISASYNMQVAYDYFRTVHGRAAIDGKDQSLLSIIHITEGGQQVDNAYWNGRMMIYGNGKDIFKPLAGSLDTGGHEMSHGVIEHTANLVYQFQPGALNESFADVFGTMIDPSNFLLGETIIQPGKGIALRDLLNPGNPQLVAPQPAHMNEFRQLTADQDNGGVHINSGIPNRAAALIIQALGHQKTEKIYYRALSNYLTRNSEFVDARNAVEQSAKDLFGEGAELQAVRQSFDAVGIGPGTGGGGGNPGGGGGGPTVPPQMGGKSLIAVMDQTGRVGMVDVTSPGNETGGLFNHPQAVALVYNGSGHRSQLTTGRSGERIWFVNSQGYLAYVDVQTGEVSVNQNLQLYQGGDLWNASIDPGENYVAIVSAYVDDPTVYIYDGSGVGAIEIRPQSSQDGIQSSTVRYPDVISWSPDPQSGNLVFDAFNSVPLGFGGTVDYWAIYEMNLSAGKIFNLLPAQPANLSVGNITYSKTNTQLVAFNTIDANTGMWDVNIGDFGTGQIVQLNLSNLTVDGYQVTDAQRPSFSPDDRELCFTSPMLGVLLFNELSSGSFGMLDLGTPLFNPHWFVLGGTSQNGTDVESEQPEHAMLLHSNYPNPFSSSTTVRFELAAAANVDVGVFDVLGRRVGTVTAGHLPSGLHDLDFDGSHLSAGTYYLRLNADGRLDHRQMIVVR